MKLYTEEVIKAAIQIGLREKYVDGMCSDEFVNNVIKYFTSIKLPTDEEIEELVGSGMHYYYKDGFIDGAKYVIEQIKKQKFGNSE